MRTLFAVLILSIALPVAAENRATGVGTPLDNVAMNAAAGTRTFTVGPDIGRVKLASYSYIVFEFDFTHANSGNIVLTCSVGQTAATANKTPQVCSGSGTCTLNDAGIFSKAVTGDKKWSARMGIRGFLAMSCVASHSGSPAAGDKLTVVGYVTD